MKASESLGIYLIYGHRAGIVLVATLSIHQLCRQRILPAIARRAGCRGRREIVSVDIVCGKSLSNAVGGGLALRAPW